MAATPNQTTHPTDLTRTGVGRRTVRRLAAVALVGVAVTFAACSSGGSTSSPASTGASPGSTTNAPSGGGGAAGADAITIKNFAFSPDSITVAPGATVTVTNKDQVAHTLTATGGMFNTGDISPGSSKTFTAPNTAGTYPYMCSIHQYMTGTLKVS